MPLLGLVQWLNAIHMQGQLTKYLTFIFILITSYNCHQIEENGKKNDNAEDSNFNKANVPGLGGNDHMEFTAKEYGNWETFWKVFTTATQRKDTASIAQLTNFPFLQNTYLTDKDEFIELWISQTYELNKTDTAVLAGDFLPGLSAQQRATLPKFDSVYYINANDKDFYFAKVNGYYRLVEIITPG